MAFRFDKLTLKSQEAVQKAQAIAQERGHQRLEPMHLLAALLDRLTLALARATSAHNALLAAESASARARAALNDAIVNAADSGACACRIAEAIGAAESEVNRIICEALQ